MERIPYIDMHCDTLTEAYWKGKTDLFDFPEAMLDVRRLREGGCQAQFFAIFMTSIDLREKLGEHFPEDHAYIRALAEILQNTLAAHSDQIAPARNFAELQKNTGTGKLSAVLTVEDGRAADGKLENIRAWYDMGVRLVSLTWNHPNCMGWPHAETPAEMDRGLTDFGREAVAYMNHLGVVVDVSHLSDGGFRDVADICKGPFAASHSDCRALSPQSRNLTDGMIRCLADHGGVAGLNFCPRFLDPGKSPASSIDWMVRHIRHLADVGGIDCVGIGSDLDGIDGTLEIGSCDRMPRLFSALSKAGFSDGEIEKIAWGNVRRMLRDTLRS